MEPIISFDRLSFTYRGGERPALRQICGQIDRGAVVAVMGHAGAGKSTLCYTLNGLVPRFFRGAYEGSVLVKGEEVARRKVAEMARHVGLVLQDFEAQLFSTNVELEMAFGPENLCLARPEIDRRIRQYLSWVGLEKLRHREPASLSGGQKQRLAIGAILAMEPEVVVMDEPTTDLDPKGRQEILEIAKRLGQSGKTLLIVDTEPETAEQADELWLIKEGRILSKGKSRQLLTDVTLLKACGVSIPPLVELFSLMGWPGNPLSPEEALSWIDKHGLIPRPFPKRPREKPRPPGPPILEVEGLRYVYPFHQTEALRGVHLSIHEGECVALLGQNGSGKTTLAKHFNGLLKPTSGSVLLRGKPTSDYSHREMARHVGFVFQNPDHQIFANTVYDEVAFGLRMLGEDTKTTARYVEEALATVGLAGYEGRSPFALSKGERQRVAVASVLAARPEILVLDEPTTGLDQAQQRSMMAMLKALHRQGHTIIVITHSMRMAEELADRTVVLKDGTVLLDGQTRAVFAEEERLAEASLRPSSIVRLSNRLGTEALTVEQMVEELKA
jgi:cobalt transport protein ATP-binding subunit